MNREHRNIDRSGRPARRLAAFLAIILLAGSIAVPDIKVQAASLSLSVSASSVKIGESVTVSITVPAGVSATVNLTYPSNLFSFTSASETANANGGTVSMTLGGYGGTDTKTTGTVKFKAKAAGTATFSATAPVAGNQEGDQVTLSGASASVKVKNEAAENNSSNNNNSGNNSGGTTDNKPDESADEPQKSADNSLASLQLSAGTLSPAFRYNIVNYTATVDYSVTSVVVSAKVSNPKASIESVKGGEKLTVGQNRIQIVVKAENGVTAVYTILVTRRAEDESARLPQEDQQEEADTPDEADHCFVVNGAHLYPAAKLPDGIAPEGFTASEITLWDQSVPCLVDTFAGGTLRLVCLTDESGADSALYLLYGSNVYEAYDFVCLKSEAGFVVALPEGDGNAPEGYTMGTCNLADKGRIDAWFFGEERSLALFYGVNQAGISGWYQLDVEELTYMRYVEPMAVIREESTEPSTEIAALPQEDSAELTRLKKENTLILGIAAIVIIILLIVIAVLALRRKTDRKEGEDDDLEFIDL